MKAKNTYFIMAKEAEANENKKDEAIKRSKIEILFTKFHGSDDLNDEMTNLAELLCEFTNATGVYIGHLVHPRREIGEHDDDRAHLDEDNPKVIMYKHASKGHEFMIEKELKVN